MCLSFQEIGQKTQFLIRHHDDLINRGTFPEKPETLSLEGTVWMNAADISRQLGEKLSDEMV